MMMEMKTLQPRRQLLLLLILLFIYTTFAQTEDDCPAADAACRCYDNNIICVDLGQRAVMPTFSPSSRNFSMLTFRGNTRILEIQQSAFDGLRVTTLDLSDLGLTSMDQAALSGLDTSVLNTLILANNSLQALPATVFAGLTSLKQLDLRNNYITQLDSNTFSDLRSSLTSLLLSDNLITKDGLRRSLLSQLGELTTLEIENNLLTTWSSQMLAGSTKITHLSLAANRLTTFPRGTFNSLRQLVMLRLAGNNIAMINNGMFENLASLRELDLSDNQLTNITENILEGLSSLETLNLSVNQLSDLPATAWSPLNSLKSIDLSLNLLRRLPHGLFDSKSTLETVNLSGNNLTITNTTLLGMTSVTTLDLSHNSICKISSSLFTNLSQLRVLDLSHNKISEMEVDLLSFSKNLETIDLSNNKLSEISEGVFHDGPKLAMIDLSRNTIQRINHNTFFNLHLSSIDLSHNEINFINASAFSHIAELSTVLLNHNRLNEVPSGLLSSIFLLNNVDLDHNLIETLDYHAFNNLYVESVSVASNKIRSVDREAFVDFYRIKTINLSDNQIEHIADDTFNHNPLAGEPISHLSLSQNRLTELTSAMFAGLSDLTSLDLSNNQIHTISDGTFSELQRLSDLRLDRNSLKSINYTSIGDIGTLRTLNLSLNRLNDQALTATRGLSGLNELYLDSNDLTSLAQLPTFASLKALSVRNNSLSSINHTGSESLSVLDLGQNELHSETLGSGLETFRNLTSLKLDENDLGSISSDAFIPFASTLEELDISGNELTSASLTAVSSLQSVRVLNMDDNMLQDLLRLAQAPITQVLRKLSVKQNRLNSAVFSVLSNFTELSTLLLDRNDIDFIPDNVFQNMHDVKVLSIKGNVVKNISRDAMSGLQQTCRYLDLSSNRLSQAALFMLKNLEHLDLSDNDLTSVTLSPIMSKLRVLQLGGNKLEMFPVGLQRFPKICTLNVSSNSLVVLPSLTVFGNSKESNVVVDFQRNRLLNIIYFRLIGSFGRVDFSSNNLRDLPLTTMMQVKYVHQLDLSQNEFSVISPTIWRVMLSVNSLNMSRSNVMLAVPNTLTTEEQQCGTILTVVDLSYNSLSNFPAGQIASFSSSLAVLDVRNNRFDTLPESEFVNMTELTHLFLAENPWNCSCELAWVRQLLQKDVYIDDAKCVIPEDTTGQLVVCYTPDDSCRAVPQPTNDSRCDMTTTRKVTPSSNVTATLTISPASVTASSRVQTSTEAPTATVPTVSTLTSVPAVSTSASESGTKSTARVDTRTAPSTTVSGLPISTSKDELILTSLRTDITTTRKVTPSSNVTATLTISPDSVTASSRVQTSTEAPTSPSAAATSRHISTDTEIGSLSTSGVRPNISTASVSGLPVPSTTVSPLIGSTSESSVATNSTSASASRVTASSSTSVSTSDHSLSPSSTTLFNVTYKVISTSRRTPPAPSRPRVTPGPGYTKKSTPGLKVAVEAAQARPLVAAVSSVRQNLADSVMVGVVLGVAALLILMTAFIGLAVYLYRSHTSFE